MSWGTFVDVIEKVFDVMGKVVLCHGTNCLMPWENGFDVMENFA